MAASPRCLRAQACNGLAETGVVDDDTWQQMLGPEAEPWAVAGLKSYDENDVDLCADGKGVWLLGEQRFERKV